MLSPGWRPCQGLKDELVQRDGVTELLGMVQDEVPRRFQKWISLIFRAIPGNNSNRAGVPE